MPVRILRVLAPLVLGAVLLVYLLPRVIGTTFTAVWQAFSTVTAVELLGLLLLWFIGLIVYSFVLTASLPGLSRRRALTLNLTGSAVANVMPLGGAAGMALNFLMFRTWKHTATEFAAFTVVTNVWSTLFKLATPAVALGFLASDGTQISSSVRWAAVSASAVLLVVLAAVLLGMVDRDRAAAIARPILRVVCLRRTHLDPVAMLHKVLVCRDTVAHVVRRNWPQLSAGMIGYTVLQAALLYACLDALGVHLAVSEVLAAYAVDRVLSVAVITPGGAGVTEAGIAAVLVALGGAPAATAAGVLLYRALTTALEVPVGGVWLGGWLLSHRHGRAAVNPAGAA